MESDDEDKTVDDKYRNKKNPKRKQPRFQEFRSEFDMRHINFKLELSFPDCQVFKDAIREYVIREGKGIYFKKNEEKKCKGSM